MLVTDTARPSHGQRECSVRQVLFALGALALLWFALDISIPRRHSLKDFDPHTVARLETEMWRSYYDHRRFALFIELAELLRSQYHLSITRSYIAGYHAARAAVVFQRGKQRGDYEKARPSLLSNYSLIRAGSDSPFDTKRAARLELEWWIIHRQRAHHAPADLPESLAALQAEIYSKPAEVFREHAQQRADAMLLRDKLAESGGVTDSDWQRIHDMLDGSWVSLKRVV
jgi:hypothetical protein